MRFTFNKTQWRVIAASMMIYTSAYLNRLNLSAALSGIREVLNITATQVGLLQTAFSITYAVGQMVNGTIVDRVNPVRHMQIGIIGSGICNLLLGLSPGYEPMIVLCLLNGAFQSMLWLPILRMIALHFSDQKSRETANIIISLTLIFGHMGAWAISGYLSGILNWRYSFLVPAMLVVPAFWSSLLLFRGINQGNHKMPVKTKTCKTNEPHFRSVLKLFAESGFLVTLVSCILFGFVRDGIKTWTPTILNSLSNGNAVAATSFSLIIPIINAGGMIIAYMVQQMGRINNRRMVAVLLALGACFCLPLLGFRSMLIAALFLGFSCACLAGLEPVLTGLVPIEYDRENLIGLTAGLIDSLVYVGSALAGVLAGLIYEGNGVNALYVCWSVSALLGAVCSLIAGRMMRQYRGKKSMN